MAQWLGIKAGANAISAADWAALGRRLLLALFVLLLLACLTVLVVYLAELGATLSVRILEV